MATTPSTSLAEEVKHLQALRRRLKAASTVQPPPSSGRPSSVPVAQTHRTIDGPSVAVLKSDNYPFTLCEEAPASYIPPPVPCDVEGEVERLKATVRLVQDELLAYATGLGKEVSPEAPAHRRLTREEALRFFRECALFSELAWDVSTIQWFYRWVLSHSISHLWSCKEQLEYALTENGQQLPQTVAEMDRCLAELPFPAAVGVLEEDRRVAVEMERQRMHSTSRTYREHVPTLAISDELPTGYLTQEEKYAYQELYNESEHALTMLHHSRKTTKGGASRGSSLGRETSGSLGPTTQLSIVARRLQTEEPEESVLADEAVQALSAESEMIRRLLEDVRIRKTTNTMPDPTFTTDYDKSRRAQIAVYGCVVSDTHLMALQMEAAAEFMEMYEEWLRYHGFENHDALMALLGNDVGEEGMAQWPLPTPSGSPTHAHFIPTREMMNDTPGATSRARNDSEAPLSRNTQHSFGGQPRTPLATARPQTPMEASNARESPAAARPQRATGVAARQPREQQQQQQPQTSSAPPPPVQRAAAAAQQKEPNTAAGRPMQRDGGAATTKPQKESSSASSARPTPRTAAGAAATQPRDTPLDRPTRQQQPSSTAVSQRCATPDNNNNVANKSATELLFTLLQHVAAHWDDHRQDLSTATLSFCWVSAAVRQVALLLLAGTWTSASALSEMNAAERELPRRVGSMGRAKDDGLVPTSQALVVVLKELLQLVERQEGPRAAEQVVPVKAPHTQEDLRDLRVSVQHALHPVELERWGAVAEAVWVQVDPSGKSSGGLMANDVPRPGMRTPSLRMEAVGLFRMHRIALHPSPSAADRAKLCLHYRTELPQTAGMEATPLSTAMQSTEHPYTRYAYTRRAVSALSVLEEHAVLARYACLLPLVPSVMMQSWIFFFFPDGLRPRSAPATRAALNTSNNEGILVGMLPPAAVQLLRIVEHLGDLSPILPGATHRSARAEKMYAVYVDGMRRGDADYSSIGLQMGNMFSSVAERSPVLQELYLMGECVREESFWEKRQDVVPKSFAHLRHLSPRCAMQMPATPHTSSTGGRTPLPIVTDPEVPSISRQLTPPLLRFLDRYLDESDAKSQAPSRSRRSGGGAESSVGAPSGRAAERSGRANNNNNNNGSSYASGAPVRASTPVTRPRSGVQAGEVLTPSHHNSRASRR